MVIKFTPTSDRENVLVVDLLNLCYRYMHSKRYDFSEELYNTLKSFARSYNAKDVYLVCDKGSSTFRKEIHSGYKQGRKDKFALQTEEEKEEFQKFFDAFEKAVSELEEKFTLFRFQGVEADDLAAYICKLLPDRTIWLISSDKDWDLLVNENVSRFSYVTRKEVSIDNWEEHYEVDIEQYLAYKCLTGDTGDSVEGVKGVGPKRAISFISQFGDVEGIIAAMPIKGTNAYTKALNESAELLRRNVKLMDLKTYCEAAIGESNCEIVKEKLCV